MGHQVVFELTRKNSLPPSNEVCWSGEPQREEKKTYMMTMHKAVTLRDGMD